MTTHFAKVNGVTIAFRVQGEGPPLVLVICYRLSSAAWPAPFIEALAAPKAPTLLLRMSPEMKRAWLVGASGLMR